MSRDLYMYRRTYNPHFFLLWRLYGCINTPWEQLLREFTVVLLLDSSTMTVWWCQCPPLWPPFPGRRWGSWWSTTLSERGLCFSMADRRPVSAPLSGWSSTHCGRYLKLPSSSQVRLTLCGIYDQNLWLWLVQLWLMLYRTASREETMQLYIHWCCACTNPISLALTK